MGIEVHGESAPEEVYIPAAAILLSSKVTCCIACQASRQGKAHCFGGLCDLEALGHL